MYCRYCGNEMSENDTFCPSCGAINTGAKPAPQQQPQQQPQQVVQQVPAQPTKMSALSVVGFVLTMLAVLCFLFSLILTFVVNDTLLILVIPAFLLSFVGIIINSVGIARCKKRNLKGKPFAVVGLVFSILTFLASLIMVAVMGFYILMIFGIFNALGGGAN